jgi:hypothetical protein
MYKELFEKLPELKIVHENFWKSHQKWKSVEEFINFTCAWMIIVLMLMIYK